MLVHIVHGLRPIHQRHLARDPDLDMRLYTNQVMVEFSSVIPVLLVRLYSEQTFQVLVRVVLTALMIPTQVLTSKDP